ncbi:MAG: hypothetical protein HKN23_12845 [Verrucomicrobiales bacterium]|nr:hypothetical protein [Verrucomicrobiales bacterium]
MPSSEHQPASRALRRYIAVLIALTVFLIWWGAATTTENAGMIFPDWPLSLGTVNPEGWLKDLAPFLEHTHRITATIVGCVTLGLFCWVYARTRSRVIETILLVVMLAVLFELFRRGGGERVSIERKTTYFRLGAIAAFVPVWWLIQAWLRRNWTLLQKFSAFALLMVTAQAILGGMRVTEISDKIAVIHGCLAQAFFCTLILLAMIASPRWEKRAVLPDAVRYGIRNLSGLLVIAIFWQLILGALMRHFSRFKLADDGILKTKGEWIPPFDDSIIVALFFHKVTALIILVLAIGFFVWLWRKRNVALAGFPRSQAMIAGLVVAQLLLGVLVIATGKSFWITNFHVLNGLAILAIAFAQWVRALRSNSEVLIASKSS